MRRSAIIITAAIVLALVGGGTVAANVLTVRDEPGVSQPVEPVIATPDPSLPTAIPGPSVEPPSSPAPVPPAPPEDLDDDDDDDDDLDDDGN